MEIIIVRKDHLMHMKNLSLYENKEVSSEKGVLSYVRARSVYTSNVESQKIF